MGRQRTNPILWNAPAALLALAAAVPMVMAGEAASALPAAAPAARVFQIADCVQRAAREFCRVAVPEAASCGLRLEACGEEDEAAAIETSPPHARRILLNLVVVDLPPPAL